MAKPEPSAVVVTGIGAVSAYGLGIERLWTGLSSGRAAIAEVKRFDPARHRTRFAAALDEPVTVAGAPRGASFADRFALVAAAEAIAGAGLPPTLFDLRAGCYFGCSTGGTWETELYYDGLTRRERKTVSVRGLDSQQTSGPGDAVARRFGICGPVQTISSACASATLAIGTALDDLRSGEVDVALAGGADALCQLTFAGFNSLRAVDPQACRPFRLGREGLTIGEGAGVLVLERAADAAARGARPLTWLRGAGASCDAHHMTAPDPSGAGVVRAIVAALADAELPATAIDFVNAHGTGTPLNDVAEWTALAQVFGPRMSQLPVTSSKGAVGHFLGSAGAIEAVATVLSIVHRAVHPTPGGGELDPACPVDLVVEQLRPLPASPTGLSTNFAFGGSNAAIILSASGPRP